MIFLTVGLLLLGYSIWTMATAGSRQRRREAQAAMLASCTWCLSIIPRQALVCRYCGLLQPPKEVMAPQQVAQGNNPHVRTCPFCQTKGAAEAPVCWSCCRDISPMKEGDWPIVGTGGRL